MAVFDTFGIVTEITEGHVPTAYLFALVGMLFTATSYGHLVRKFPSAGSPYAMPRRCFPLCGLHGGLGLLLDLHVHADDQHAAGQDLLEALFPGTWSPGPSSWALTAVGPS